MGSGRSTDMRAPILHCLNLAACGAEAGGFATAGTGGSTASGISAAMRWFGLWRDRDRRDRRPSGSTCELSRACGVVPAPSPGHPHGALRRVAKNIVAALPNS